VFSNSTHHAPAVVGAQLSWHVGPVVAATTVALMVVAVEPAAVT
jgi:hypothetical protein